LRKSSDYFQTNINSIFSDKEVIMKHKFILPIAAVLLSFAGVVSANQVIHVNNQVSQSPAIHWVSYPGSEDGVEVHLDSHRYNILVTADRQYNGKNTCKVVIDGCNNVAALQPGDIALCEPTTQAIFILARCADNTGVAAGTIRYIKK
jgi:hypothetical protein